jgi:hypothetical protein
MRIPKLKYYYHALNPADYKQFEQSRQLLINQPATINMATGQVSRVIPFHYLYSQPTTADTRYRQLNSWTSTVYVLRIPAHIIPRAHLESTEDPRGMWLCRANLSIAHCGVEAFELATQVPEVKYQIVASSKQTHANNHNNLA